MSTSQYPQTDDAERCLVHHGHSEAFIGCVARSDMERLERRLLAATRLLRDSRDIISGLDAGEGSPGMTNGQRWHVEEIDAFLKEFPEEVNMDSVRMDALPSICPNLAAQISRNAISTPTLRKAIDDAIKTMSRPL